MLFLRPHRQPIGNVVRIARINRVHGASQRVALSTLRNETCLTVSLDLASSTKQQVAEVIISALSPTPSATALILASKGLAPWLQDAAFLSQILAPLASSTSSLSVLGAAVDSTPVTAPYASSEGFSLFSSPTDTLLPKLWKEEVPTDHPSLTFHLPPLTTHPLPLSITLPLANTLFQNGRPHTMLASRWRRTTGEPRNLELVQVAERTHQAVDIPFSNIMTSRVALPLVPITKARKVATGLGNILRQVEVEGRLVPASKELEEVIPMLLEARAKTGVRGKGKAGPIGVWAVVYPAGGAYRFPRALELGEEGEWERAGEVERGIGALLAGGGHLRRILSGGGGWGLKQGLLSLDPQTKYSTGNEEDVENFIRSFHREDSGSGVVTPGTYIQFMVEPAGPRPDGELLRGDTLPAVVIGTQGSMAEKVGWSGIQVQHGLFGGVSSHGIYLESGATNGHSEITTKIDSSMSLVAARME